MKGNDKVIAILNDLLADELTAINQYMVHSEMVENWGYKNLHTNIRKRAMVEMQHAEKLIERIIFLEGTPIVSHLRELHIGPDVQGQLKHDWDAEATAVRGYNNGVRIATEAGDHGTREILASILSQEESHIDWIESQQDEIKQMGIQQYLSVQTLEHG